MYGTAEAVPFQNNDLFRGSLELFTQEFEHDIADEGGDEGDDEIRAREYVDEGEGEGFAVGVGGGELAHEEIGIEEEDDERDLNDRPPEGGETAAICGDARHGFHRSKDGIRNL